MYKTIFKHLYRVYTYIVIYLNYIISFQYSVISFLFSC